MAYAALVSLAQTIDLILNHDRYTISVDAREEIRSIREQVIFLTSFLDDFPEKANRRLEGKIRDVANEAENIIEYFMWKQIGVSWWTIGLSRVEFEQQLGKATEEIGLLVGEMMEDRCCDLPAAIPSSRLAPAAKSDVVIGLDEDLLAMKCRLCGEPFKLQVIPIVGMGGIGKTTLALNAYNDPLIMEYFDIRVWVTISQDYSKLGILISLLNSMKLFREQMFEQKDEGRMAKKVYQNLKNRRYLMVMDDIWSIEAWDDVRNIFPDDDNGSRIILTTRLSDVAAYANFGSPIHEMKFMDGNQSWNLLKHKLFTNHIGQDCPPELEDVGKEITESCRGLPLAIVLAAGILSTVNKTRGSWEKIARDVNSVVDGRLEEILSLSYTHLPHHLRPCFLFIGGFPEDYEIRVSKLIKLWVAEGFLKHQDGCRSLEEDAEEYLEDLVRRSLVLVSSRKANGKIKTCSLHDLVRDLCKRIAREEKFLAHVPGSTNNERRISIACSLQNKIWGPTIHTILCFQLGNDSFKPLDFLGSFRLLRVLHAVNVRSGVLLSQVFQLFHLRYLALGYPLVIPSTISNLENLQTLICPFSSSPPMEIWRMPQLRHLVFSYLYELPDPANASTLLLENLQTFSLVASDLVCSEKTLKMMPNLRKLGIICNQHQDYQPYINFTHLLQLEKLKVIMSRKCAWHWHNLALPKTLKKLTLVGAILLWKDMNIVGSLPYLEVLKLEDHACRGDTWETIGGDFPQLKFLMIKKSRLRHWITKSSHFPRLKCLKLCHCQYLSEIPEGIGEIPTLEVIDVDYVNTSLVMSAKHIQEDQLSYGNDALQIQVQSHQPRTTRKKDKWRQRRRHLVNRPSKFSIEHQPFPGIHIIQMTNRNHS